MIKKTDKLVSRFVDWLFKIARGSEMLVALFIMLLIPVLVGTLKASVTILLKIITHTLKAIFTR